MGESVLLLDDPEKGVRRLTMNRPKKPVSYTHLTLPTTPYV